jgi:uncharacterized protein YjbI with pentapeptide repeats
MPVQQKAINADTAMTRTDVVHLLQEGGNPEQLDVSHHDLRGINLMNGDLRGANLDWATLYGAFLGRADLRGTSLDKTYVRGADLSWASFGDASDYEQLKHRLWRRGAIFREKPRVRVAGRSSERAGRHALGIALGFLLMSVVGLLCVLGIRIIRTRMRLKRHPGDRTAHQVGTSPECRS